MLINCNVCLLINDCRILGIRGSLDHYFSSDFFPVNIYSSIYQEIFCVFIFYFFCLIMNLEICMFISVCNFIFLGELVNPIFG